jgi:hypothetical protein
MLSDTSDVAIRDSFYGDNAIFELPADGDGGITCTGVNFTIVPKAGVAGRLALASLVLSGRSGARQRS